MKLILPKVFVEKRVIEHSLFFLAGPVLGGGNWQEKCCETFAQLAICPHIVIPCRWDHNNRFYKYSVPGAYDVFPRQTAWEYHYLKLACELSKEGKGCIIFWLPCESKTSPRTDGQPYARDTRGELGRWSSFASQIGGTIIIGAEPGFSGLSVIKENSRLDFKVTDFPIYQTLAATIAAAVETIKV